MEKTHRGTGRYDRQCPAQFGGRTGTRTSWRSRLSNSQPRATLLERWVGRRSTVLAGVISVREVQVHG